MQNWLEQISTYVLGKALGSASGDQTHSKEFTK